MDVKVVVQGTRDKVDLLVKPRDEVRPIATSDEQALDAWANQPAVYSKPWPALVALRVDDEDTTRRDGDVVDVRPGSRDATIMENADASLCEAVQHRTHQLFAARPGGPGPRALRLLEERQQESADAWESAADPRFPCCLPPLIHEQGGRSGYPRMDLRSIDNLNRLVSLIGHGL